MFTTFSLLLSKILRISFGVAKLILTVWLILFSTAEGLRASAEEYDPAAVALLEKIKKENISPRFPFFWFGSDYSRWQGVTWSDERPRRLKALTLPYADYDEKQGPIFEQRRGSRSIDIHDISGLEHLTINIGATEFKIHDLPDLQVMDLAGGKQLSLESLAGLPNLRELDLSWRAQDNILFDPTKLHHLSVLKNLQSLKLASTEFSKPGLRGVLEVLSEVLKSLPELRKIDLSGHNLTTLGFLENLPLTSLNLRKNPIRSLAGLETLTELRNLELNLNYTLLEETSGLSKLAKLESLDISERANEVWTLAANHPRMITIPDLSALTGLKRLSLGPVYYPVEEDLSQLANLEELHLDLCDLPNIQNDSNREKKQRSVNKFGGLIGLKNLKWLDVSCLGELRYEYLPLLEHLDRLELKRWCHHHSGRLGRSDDSLNLEFLSRLKNIKQLSLQRYFLDGSGFTGLGSLAGLDSLIDLDLSRNHIPTTLGLKDMKNLTKLNLSRNRLSRLDGLVELAALEELDLRGNLLTDLNWEEMPSQIRRLNLNSNMFYRIDKLARLTRLEELNISRNPLVDFSGLGEANARLKNLDLSKTKFSDLTLLRNFKNLEVLNLEECEISGPVDLSYWPNLKQLNIKNNRITTINGWESLPEGAVIDVACNSLPLSLLFQLQEDSKNSGRQWRMGWRCGFSRMSIQFCQWDVFDPKEVKVGEIYDLSQESVLGGIKTRFRIGELFESSGTKRRNNFPGVVNLTRLKAGDPSKSSPDQAGEVCTEEQGRFIFNKPGRYILLMDNSGIGYDSYRGIEVGTSSITVK